MYEEVEDTRTYNFVVNHEEQYSIWLADKKNARDLEMAKANMRDIAISDLMISGTDDIEFAKAFHNAGNLPLLFLTAVSSEGTQLSCLNLGAVDFIHKPFNPAVIQLKVQNFIEEIRRLAERFGQTSTVATKEICKKVSKYSKFIGKLDTYIEKHLSEKITVEGMAASLFMDRSAFTRKVKALTTLNTQQYILHYRLAKAYNFLPAAQSVAEVANKLGFSTQNHLSTAFSKQFGITCRDRMSGKESIRHIP